jgi:hypothetical protein
MYGINQLLKLKEHLEQFKFTKTALAKNTSIKDKTKKLWSLQVYEEGPIKLADIILSRAKQGQYLKNCDLLVTDEYLLINGRVYKDDLPDHLFSLPNPTP